MGGCGKTSLAAEALRDGNLIEECFPDGVVWLTIGQLSDEDGQVRFKIVFSLSLSLSLPFSPVFEKKTPLSRFSLSFRICSVEC